MSPWKQTRELSEAERIFADLNFYLETSLELTKLEITTKEIPMKTTIFILASLISAFAMATEPETAPRSEWLCWATGRFSTSIPGDFGYHSVSGRGATEADASDDAMQACYGMGLQMCMPNGCQMVDAQD